MRFSLFQLRCNFQGAFAGGNHVVNDNHILAFYACSKKFMSYDRIATIFHSRIIPAFIKHTHVQTDNIRHIDSPAHTAFVGADNHHVVGIQFQPFYILKDTFDKLIGRLYRFKTMKGNCILHPGVVGIKGNDIVYPH